MIAGDSGFVGSISGAHVQASQVTNLWLEEWRHAARPQAYGRKPASAKEVGAGRRPEHREYQQHSSIFCPQPPALCSPLVLRPPVCRLVSKWLGAVRGINRFGAGICLRARREMTQKASEARSGLRLSKSGLVGRQPGTWNACASILKFECELAPSVCELCA